MNQTEAREERAKKYWHEHQLSYDGPEPKPWETMAAFARLEIDRARGEFSRAPQQLEAQSRADLAERHRRI